MLKYIYILFVASFLAMACEPLEDAYNEIEEEALETGSDKTISYSLTSDDYATVAGMIEENGTAEDTVAAEWIEDNEAFSPTYEAKSYLPAFVDDAFASHGKGTAVKVTYNYFTAESEDFSDYLSAENHTVDGDGYAAYSEDAGKKGFFDSAVDEDAFIVEWLATEEQDAQDGDIVSITYNSIDQLYSELTGETVFSEDFATDLGDFEAISVTGDDQVWHWETLYGDNYAKMSGYDGGSNANDDWLVSPAIDLSDAEGTITVTVDQIWNYGSSDWGEEVDVLYSTDSATWVSIDLDETPEGTSWDNVVGSAELADVQGGNLYIAFHYTSTDSETSTWEVVDVKVEEGAAPEIEFVNDFYQYDGEVWASMSDEVKYLGSRDYGQMGAPGEHDNFSSSVLPEDYFPSYLSAMFPFAQEGDSYDVVFKYYDGSTKTLAERYTVEEGAWTGTFYIEQVDQYKHDGTSFVFDPSVSFTMSSSDYQIIVDEVAKSQPDLVDSYGTAEFYYGSGAYYENFDLRAASRISGDYAQSEYAGLSADEATALLVQRMGEGIELLLELKYPDATTVPGVDVFYTVNCASYDGSDGSWVTVFEVTGPGEFALLEGPTAQ